MAPNPRPIIETLLQRLALVERDLQQLERAAEGLPAGSRTYQMTRDAAQDYDRFMGRVDALARELGVTHSDILEEEDIISFFNMPTREELITPEVDVSLQQTRIDIDYHLQQTQIDARHGGG